ncbi:hypothetical protein [Endozoicomonas ascidiicola]|uniref:hypothetical protein n=1 Tax=Endozoicomonas ascidiicola TaxID=1698521 RepID=UPI0012FAF078|nr:hypothetical protein [Endozoicomonas ascidiicola]
MPAFFELDDYSCTIESLPNTGKSSPHDVFNVDHVTYCDYQMTRQIDVAPTITMPQSLPTY